MVKKFLPLGGRTIIKGMLLQLGILQLQRRSSLVLGALFLVLLQGAPAFSQEKDNQFQLTPKDVYFQPGGGIRVRYEKLLDATGAAFSQDENEAQASHRAQIDLKLYKGEYFETFFRLINFAEWGGTAGDTNGGQHNGYTRNNGLLVNQAWGFWKMDQSIGLKFGRMPLHFGLGYTYGGNDWFNVPYSFDSVGLLMDWESVKLALIGAKVGEFTKVNNQTLSSDPEENHIIVNVDIKNLTDAINILNFSLVQVNRDSGSMDNGVTVLDGLNMQRLAIEAAFNAKNIFATAFVSYVTGEKTVAPINRINNIDKVDLAQTAADIKVGYRFPSANDLSFWAGYHFDSGDKIIGDNESQSYDSFYYEVYGQAGLMDFLRWGNLSFYRLGMDVDIKPGVTVGAEWLEFSKTEQRDVVHFGDAGRFLSNKVTTGDLVFNQAKNLGSEMDLWLDYQFDHGIKTRATLSSFFPGDVFKNATTSTGLRPTTAISQILFQIGYFF